MNKKKAGYFFLVRYLLGCVVSSILMTGCVTPINTKKTFAKASKSEPMDVIIVPGLPYDTCDMPTLMKYRMYWAKLLYDSGITKHIIFSGSSVYTPYKEGEIMKIMADSMGIPPDKTFAETRAEHSTENLYYSWKLAHSMGFTRIGLATDPFQMLLLKRYRRRYCKDVQLIPVYMKIIDWESVTLPKIDAQPAYVENFVPLKDRENFWERFQYTMGKRVRAEVKAQTHEQESLSSNRNPRPRSPYSSD
jgi:uncharacterized SAM-binding protein YcdF (DUF218 family)